MVFGQKRKIRLALAKTHSKEQMEKDREKDRKREYLHRQLDEVFEHRKRKKKRSTKKKKKGIGALTKQDKKYLKDLVKSSEYFGRRTKLGKSVNVNLRNVNRTLGSSTFFN